MKFHALSEFQKDLKQLEKRFRSLPEDFEVLKKVLAAQCTNHPQPPLSFRVADLGFEEPAIIKVKKFACKSLKGRGANTGLRVIYAYHHQQQLIEFIQLYFKSDHENEDRLRIKEYYFRLS